jgi:hypothetical protein
LGLALFLLAAQPVNAQTPRFDLGLQVGPGLSWLRGNDVIDGTDALLGPAAGLTFQYDLSEHFGIRLGAGYQRKGTRDEVLFTDVNGTPTGTADVAYTTDFLTFPLMARYAFGQATRFSVGLGPYAGMLLQAKETWSGTGLQGGDVDRTDDLEPWDFGLSASASAAWSLGGNLWINAEVRYDKGLTNISALPVVDDGSIRTNAVSLLVGCSYRFGSTR